MLQSWMQKFALFYVLSDPRILVYRLGFLLILLQIDRPDPSVLLKVKPSIPISGNNCPRSELFSPLLL